MAKDDWLTVGEGEGGIGQRGGLVSEGPPHPISDGAEDGAVVLGIGSELDHVARQGLLARDLQPPGPGSLIGGRGTGEPVADE